jgi:two-component sensor histidine kinase
VISSLLSLQATQIKDERTSEVFKDSQTRVRAMALVHERLYQSADLARIDFSGYVRDMTNHLLRSYQNTQRGVSLKLDVMPVSFDIDTAIPCALIINELVSNSLKYGFPDGRKGEVSVRLSEEDDNCARLVISDNGVGLPSDISFDSTDSLGLNLVHSLTKQLDGNVRYRSQGGAEFEIRFKMAATEAV